MSRRATSCNAQVSLPWVCAGGETVRRRWLPTLLLEVNAKMEHTKKGHWVVGLIILIVFGYLAYHVAYLAIQ